MRRTMDATRLNVIANHPDVRPWLGGEGVANLQPLLDDPANVALEGEHGGFLAVRLEDDLYDVHSLFVPEGRGVETMQAMRAAARYYFLSTPARTLVTRVPMGNLAAFGLTRMAGFERQFTRTGIWADGSDVGFWALSIERWAQRTDECRLAGQRFHETLEAAKEAQGSKTQVHPDDPVHDAMVGLAILLAQSGQPAKGLTVYNRWARIAGYLPGIVVTWDPLVIDIGEAFVQMHQGQIEVLQCRH